MTVNEILKINLEKKGKNKKIHIEKKKNHKLPFKKMWVKYYLFKVLFILNFNNKKCLLSIKLAY